MSSSPLYKSTGDKNVTSEVSGLSPRLRRKLLWVSPDLLVELLQFKEQDRDFFIHQVGIPADMKIVGVTWIYGNVVLTVESQEFEEIEIGAEFPKLRVRFARIDIERALQQIEMAS